MRTYFEIGDKMYDPYRIAENCIAVLQRASVKRDIPVYKLFQNVEGWSYDRSAYYFRRDPEKITMEFLSMIIDNFDCTMDDLLNGAERK